VLARPELLSRRPAWSGDALKLEPLPNSALPRDPANCQARI